LIGEGEWNVFRVRVSRGWYWGIKGGMVNDEIEYKAD
jgi:hypothetical protein